MAHFYPKIFLQVKSSLNKNIKQQTITLKWNQSKYIQMIQAASQNKKWQWHNLSVQCNHTTDMLGKERMPQKRCKTTVRETSSNKGKSSYRDIQQNWNKKGKKIGEHFVFSKTEDKTIKLSTSTFRSRYVNFNYLVVHSYSALQIEVLKSQDKQKNQIKPN